MLTKCFSVALLAAIFQFCPSIICAKDVRGHRAGSAKARFESRVEEKAEPSREIAPLSTDLFVDGCTKVPVCLQNGSIEKPFSTIQAAINRASHIESCFEGCHTDCQVITILIAGGIYGCEPDCEDNNIFIGLGGRTKLSLIGLGPVTLGCVTGCACQPVSHPDIQENNVVGIVWVPNPGTSPKGVRPTLTITTINSVNDSITPYQSYSSKFRVTGDITICNADTCYYGCNFGTSPAECPEIDNSEHLSHCKSSSSSSSSSCSEEPVKKTVRPISLASYQNKIALTDDVKRKKMAIAPQQNGNGAVCDICNTGGQSCNCGEPTGNCENPGSSASYFTTVGELSFNGEVFGNIHVTGTFNLYFYKARVHGELQAPDSDVVVAERTRFDDAVNIYHYGTIIGCEFQNGLQVNFPNLNDPSCVSITLHGIFMTNIVGNLVSNQGCGCEVFLLDVTSYAMFLRNCGKTLDDSGACCSDILSVIFPCNPANLPTGTGTLGCTDPSTISCPAPG